MPVHFFRNVMSVIVVILSVMSLNSCQNDEILTDNAENKISGKIFVENIVDNDEVKSFWYNGKLYHLTPDYSKLFVVRNNDESSSLSSLSEGYLSLANTTNDNEKKENKSDYKWQVIDGSSMLLNDRHSDLGQNVVYSSPFYISEISGKQVGVSNLIHVKLNDKDDVDILNSQLNVYGLSIYCQNTFMPEWYTLSCNSDKYGDALDICMKLHESGLFSIVEPDFLCDNLLTTTTFAKPNDPYYSQQWNLSGSNSINWPDASVLSTGKNVNVALIDTGVEKLHPDLRSSSVNPAYDSYTKLMLVNGLYGAHGTSCAGIIAATMNNQVGIVGISSGVTLHSYADKMQLRPNISHDLASALSMALRSVDVLSCSWGGADLISSEITDAIKMYMPEGRNGKGVVVVFSSGNDNSSVLFPANCNPDIIVVGSTDKSGNRSSFSNYGDELDVMAPGEYIYTLGFNGESTYGYNSDFRGTSASCPQVAAIAALMIGVNNKLTNVQVATIIEQTARKTGLYSYTSKSDRPNGTWNKYMGYGLVDAAAAVKKAKATSGQ